MSEHERQLEWGGEHHGVALVERDGDRPCCPSCVEEANEGYGDAACRDYCCCIHGELFGYRWDFADDVTWVTPESEARFAAIDPQNDPLAPGGHQ